MTATLPSTQFYQFLRSTEQSLNQDLLKPTLKILVKRKHKRDFWMQGRISPLKGVKLGLVASIQHLHLVFDYKKRFEDAGFEVEVPVGGARLTFPGQVLGCNYSGDDDEIGHYLFPR